MTSFGTALRVCVAGALALGLCARAGAAPVPTEATALGQVPATAPLVFHLRGVDGTVERFLAFLKEAFPDLHEPAAAFLDMTRQNGFDGGRHLQGVAKDGPIFIAFTELPKTDGSEPSFAAVVAVTDYAKFRDGLLFDGERKQVKDEGDGVQSAALQDGSTLYFLNRKGFAVVTPKKGVATDLAKKAPGLDTKLSKDEAAKLLASDLGVYLALDVFSKEYAQQVKNAREATGDALKALGEAARGSDRSVVDAAGKLVEPLFQAVEDSRGMLFTLEFRPAGLALHFQSAFRPGSATAQLLKSAKPSAFPELNELPGKRMTYSGIVTGPVTLDKLGPLAFGVVVDPKAPQAKAVAAAMTKLVQAGPRGWVDTSSWPTAGVQAYGFDSPEKGEAALLELFAALPPGATVQTGVLKEAVKVRRSARQHKGVTFHEVTLPWDLEKMASGFAGQEPPPALHQQIVNVLKAQVGDSTTVYVGPTDKQVLLVRAATWDGAKQLIDDLGDGDRSVGVDPQFKKVRSELPAEATVIGMVDLVPFSTLMTQVFKPVLPGVALKPPPQGKPSYIGAAATVRPDSVAADVFLSTQALKDAYKAFR